MSRSKGSDGLEDGPSDISPSDIKTEDLDDFSEEDLQKIPRTERHLNRLRVKELRIIARDECGPGTWISHASKDQLVKGAIAGRQPRDTHKEDRGSEDTGSSWPRSDSGPQATSSAYAGDMGESLMDLLLELNVQAQDSLADAGDTDEEEAKEKVKEAIYEDFSERLGGSLVDTVLSVTNQVIERKVKVVEERLARVEEELGIDTGGDVSFSKEEVQSLFRQQIKESDEAEEEARRRVDDQADNQNAEAH
ncbi:hypothetical protein [Salinibacter ruber]|uniref:Uncharacterized protein n=1 Tax=Salinibacter ruber TaxID=146919 RepID=A0A9X2QFL0_9BACT|nr:hypothetical protein [Salinibacter ruber]MCS3661751.1 hypothetical protein [Salinibacter ruber]MCS3711588.1 hypothetical protein [Salinibacter ruber]